jgi:hypothetical protein
MINAELTCVSKQSSSFAPGYDEFGEPMDVVLITGPIMPPNATGNRLPATGAAKQGEEG